MDSLQSKKKVTFCLNRKRYRLLRSFAYSKFSGAWEKARSRISCELHQKIARCTTRRSKPFCGSWKTSGLSVIRCADVLLYIDLGSLRSFLNRYFRGSRSELLVNLLENERIDPTELQELERLIRSYRKASGSGKK